MKLTIEVDAKVTDVNEDEIYFTLKGKNLVLTKCVIEDFKCTEIYVNSDWETCCFETYEGTPSIYECLEKFLISLANGGTLYEPYIGDC